MTVTALYVLTMDGAFERHEIPASRRCTVVRWSWKPIPFFGFGIADYVFTVCAHHYDATQDANNVGINRDVSIPPQTVKLIWKTYDAEGLIALF